MATNGGDKSSVDPGKPYIAIVVLVCGVIGGLIIVISFIFFCKFCFKKNQPLASAASPPDKNEPYAIKPKNPKQGYQILDGSNSLASPVPADLETYLQQPANINNNNLDILKSEFLLVNPLQAKELAAQKKLCQIAEDELLIIQTEIEDDDKPLFRGQGSADDVDVDRLFRKCSLKRNEEEDIEVLSIKQASASTNRINESRSRRQRAYSNACDALYPPKNAANAALPQVDASPRRQRFDASLSVQDPFIEAARRRSFDERLTGNGSSRTITDASLGQGVGKRRLPNVAQLNNFYANEYDRKQFGMDDETPLNSLSTDEASIRVPGWSQQQPLLSPGIHLPHSHQTIADKSSPPSAAAVARRPPTAIMTAAGGEGPYPRDHRNSKSYGMAEQDLAANAAKNMYARDHRLAFSFTDTGEPRHLPVITNFKVTQPTILLLSPDRRSDVSSSLNSGYEAETLNRFYIRCREVFDKTPAGYVSTGLSSSSSENRYGGLNNGTRPAATSVAPRQAKSVETADRYGGGAAGGLLSERQAQSLDSSGCKVCLNDVINRMTLVDRQQSLLRRQQTLDDADSELEHLDDAYSEKIKKQCKDLWSLRRILEDEPYDDTVDNDRDDVMVGYNDHYALPSPDADDGGGTTSYTTSFESNTEPLTVEDYLRSTRPSGPFLEPPRLSVEAKRAKLKNLYAKRQLQLQQQGVSIESYESYETVDSSESSKPEQILTSFESNHGEQAGTLSDSTVDSRRRMVALQKDSGYKSQSTETAGHGHDISIDKSAPPPPSPAVPMATYRQPLDRSFDQQQQSFDSTLSDCCLDVPDPPAPPSASPMTTARGGKQQQHVAGGRHHMTSRERDAVGAFFEAVNGNDTPSGESFDDTSGGGVASIPGVSTVDFPAASAARSYPNVHLARMRRSFDSPLGVATVGPVARDYSVDAHTDALYREFVKFDPRLEQKAPSRRGLLNNNASATKRGRENSQRYGFDADQSHHFGAKMSTGSGGRLKQKLSTEDSIEEERGPMHDYGGGSDVMPPCNNRYDIPIIKLPDDNDSFSGVKVQ